MDDGVGVFMFGVLITSIVFLILSIGEVSVQGSVESVLTTEYCGKVYRLVELK